MHLSRLRLVGFKSFPQGTDLSFEPGITAIVGPNGCGKSNLADAIRWVLGEQGHRILRAERMEDVIFHGNGTCQPQGMAEVSLTISDHEAELPTEFSEINITRRLFRSGESQYLLNGAPCLLRDILNLFLDSGLGNTPYALIEQGTVASVVDSRPWEKKAMIDEAAGIMKYKVRRKAAVAKLEAAGQNLLRLQDIIREVEQQRNSLSRQAKKAREYQEARRRIESLEGYLRLKDYQGAEIKLAQIEETLKERADEGISLTTQISHYQGRLEEEQLQLLSLEKTFQETQQSLIRIQGEKEKAKAQVEILTREKEELAKREEKAQVQLLTLTSQFAELREALSGGREEIDALREGIGSLLRREEEVGKEAEGLSQEISRISQSLEEKRREAIAAAALCSNVRNTRAALESQGRKLDQQIRKIEAQQEARSSERAELQERQNALEKTLQELGRRFAELGSRRAQAREDLASVQEEIRGSEIALSQCQRQVDELSSRLSSYQELQRSYSDYGEGARLLLQKRDGSPPGTFRPELLMAIGELLETQSGCERAIESLLGSEVKGLVVKDVEEIHRIIKETEVLQKGGATFLPLSFLPDSGEARTTPPARPRPLASLPGVLGQAIDLIRVEPPYQGLMRRLLGDSLVVEDLEVALQLCRQPKCPRVIATLKGEVITSWGVIRLASDSTSGLLLRQREIKD
ncbi:MAG: AAA family ATPase, partial [candidate division NC10 bacterium]|nr:AAA family ATPase [candidate division NC10 bacterium]